MYDMTLRIPSSLRERFLRDTRALPPVIGTVLLVGIAVILAALIATFTLGYAAEQEVAPQASWVIDENPNGESGTIAFVHDGGDTVETSQLMLAAENLDENLQPDEEGSLESRGRVTFTHEELDTGMTVRLVWEHAGSGETHVLRTHTLTDRFD